MSEGHPEDANPFYELLEVVAIGFPYCCFKLIGGTILSGAAAPTRGAAGAALVALGAADLAINAANAASLVFLRRRALDACLFSVATRAVRRGGAEDSAWRNFGDSLDVLLCCALVVWVIARGGLGAVPARLKLLWSLSVILNVLAAGVGRFARSVRRLAGS